MAFTANSKFLLVMFKTKNYPKHSQIFQSLCRTAKSVCLFTVETLFKYGYGSINFDRNDSFGEVITNLHSLELVLLKNLSNRPHPWTLQIPCRPNGSGL